MNALVVYHTVHGNTEQVARAVAEGLGGSGAVVVKTVGEAGPEGLTAAFDTGSRCQDLRSSSP